MSQVRVDNHRTRRNTSTDMVLAASRHQRTIGIIQSKETRSLGSDGLSSVATIPPRLIVREKRNRHLDSLINKGGGNPPLYALAHQVVLRIYKTAHKELPIAVFTWM
jgi:hypothetical protein